MTTAKLKEIASLLNIPSELRSKKVEQPVTNYVTPDYIAQHPPKNSPLKLAAGNTPLNLIFESLFFCEYLPHWGGNTQREGQAIASTSCTFWRLQPLIYRELFGKPRTRSRKRDRTPGAIPLCSSRIIALQARTLRNCDHTSSIGDDHLSICYG